MLNMMEVLFKSFSPIRGHKINLYEGFLVMLPIDTLKFISLTLHTINDDNDETRLKLKVTYVQNCPCLLIYYTRDNIYYTDSSNLNQLQKSPPSRKYSNLYFRDKRYHTI